MIVGGCSDGHSKGLKNHASMRRMVVPALRLQPSGGVCASGRYWGVRGSLTSSYQSVLISIEAESTPHFNIRLKNRLHRTHIGTQFFTDLLNRRVPDSCIDGNQLDIIH